MRIECEKLVKTILLFFHFTSDMLFSITIRSFGMHLLQTQIYENQIQSIQEVINGSFELAGDDCSPKNLIIQNEVNRNAKIMNFITY